MFFGCYNYNRCCCYRNMEKYEITMEEMKQKQMQGALIVDIRSPQEYKEGHINNAISLPEYDIYKKVKQVIPNMNQEIVVYCGTGIRSRNALRILKRLGYNNVYNLYKGTENY